MIRPFRNRLALCVLALTCTLVFNLTPQARGQVLTGTLTGTISDPGDAVIPNVDVTATDTGSGRKYTEKTNNGGVYTFTNLPNSTYTVTVEANGFSKEEVANVRVDVSQTAHINVKLQIAKTGTEIVVQAEQTTVQSESAELKSTVDSAQLDALPLPTRNPLDLVKSFAGILTPNTTAVTGGDAFVHGLRGNDTNITQDGINVQDSTVKTSAFFVLSSPVADTIDEINVSVGGIGTDGGFGAAQVSMVTKKGTNDYHGTLYWYQRTSFLNANTWFNNDAGVRTPFQLQNHIGATVGGPASLPKLYNGKNKTFFFFAYEAYREPRASPTTRTVMTPSAEQGLFTYTPTGSSAPVTVNLLNIGTIGASTTKPALNPVLSALYAKIVPQSGFTDTGCGSGDGVNIRCVVFNESGVNNQDRYTVRMDQQIGQRNSLQFVWNRSNFNTSPDFLNSNQPPFIGAPWSGGQISSREDFVWALTSTIAPTQTNEVRIGYTHAPVSFAYGYQFGDTGGSQVAYSTVTSPLMTSTNFPQGRNSPVQQYIDNYAWVKGKHQMRFGGEYRRNLATDYLYNTVFPRVILGTNASNPDNLSSSTLPGISAAELTLANSVFVNDVGLLGSISQGFNHTSPTSGYVPGVAEQYTPIQQNLAFYFQDTWKVRPNLTVQYGVRWEYQGPYDARNGLVLLPQNNLSSLFGPTNSGGSSPVGNLFQPGNLSGATDTTLTLQGGSNGKPVTQRDLNNFGPFLGVAYTPFTDGKTVIRAHFAQHYVQDGFTFYTPATTTNTGLFSTFSNSTPTGVFANSGLPLPTPAAGSGGFPVSQLANWINSGGTANLINYSPSLVTPYVLDWGFGIQRELYKKFTMEVRYVGNHAVKQYRNWSINELDLNNNGLLTEFNNALNNYNIDKAKGVAGSFAYSGLPGQVPTPILDKLFAGVATSAGYGSSTFITNLTQNNIYSMFNTIRTSPTYRTNVMGAAGTGASNGLPLNFFVANPWAANAAQVNNAGWSYYDGLEVEVKRQFSGFFMLANYSFSKVFADTTFAESQNESQNYQSLQNTRLDKFVSPINVRHSFGLTTSYPLPVGRGKRFLPGANRITDAIIGGWVVNGLTHWSTGAPLTLSSARLTTGSGIAQTPVLQNLSLAKLQDNIGVYKTPNGVYFINPQLGLFTISGSTSTANFCTAGQTTPCFSVPAPGQAGNLPYDGFSGPHFFNQDFSIAKDTVLFERLRFHIALEAFDVFNHPNFAGPSLSTDSTTFGQLTTTFDTARGGGVTSRIVQWTMKFIF